MRPWYQRPNASFVGDGPSTELFGLELRALGPCQTRSGLVFRIVWRESASNHFLRTGRNTRSCFLVLHSLGRRCPLVGVRPTPSSFTKTILQTLRIGGRSRINDTASHRRVLRRSTEVFLQFDGCFEQNFVLQEAIPEANAREKELVVAWLHLTNAFNSGTYSSIFWALEGHGLPAKAINTITSMYSQMETGMMTAEGVTGPTQIRSGVKQGCQLRPWLNFASANEGLLCIYFNVYDVDLLV